ncbi:MAG: c-type cytochrome [Proteobacteria bacterium]|nr:c-type cytochrome [Pseudomonadota bacterium]HOL37950.1 c-type cytochrome [Rubrivivax sp.]
MIKAPSLLLATLALAAVAPLHAQDAAAGAKKAAMCIGCHDIPRYQTSFPEVYKVPKIGGQNAAYLVAALGEYKKGERRFATMRAIAGSLSDKDMADLAAYYEKLPGPMIKTVADTPAVQPSAAVADLLTRGACTSCHGANLSKPISPAYPKLAGQYGDYLYATLRSYGTVGNPNVGRSNPIMGAQVKQFKNTELRQLADYIASLPGEIFTVPDDRFR